MCIATGIPKNMRLKRTSKDILGPKGPLKVLFIKTILGKNSVMLN